jgi:hypothetical protein
VGSVFHHDWCFGWYLLGFGRPEQWLLT